MAGGVHPPSIRSFCACCCCGCCSTGPPSRRAARDAPPHGLRSAVARPVGNRSLPTVCLSFLSGRSVSLSRYNAATENKSFLSIHRNGLSVVFFMVSTTLWLKESLNRKFISDCNSYYFLFKLVLPMSTFLQVKSTTVLRKLRLRTYSDVTARQFWIAASSFLKPLICFWFHHRTLL